MRSMLSLGVALGSLLLAGAALAFPLVNDAKKKDAAKPVLTDAAVKRLAETEKALAKPDDAMKKLHEQAFKTFALREGFGMERMYRPLNAPPPEKWASEDIDKEPKAELAKELEPLHGISALNFSVFTRAPKEGLSVLKGNEKHLVQAASVRSVWRMSQVDLVGLVKNPQPRVYISPANPDMRPLIAGGNGKLAADAGLPDFGLLLLAPDMEKLKELKQRDPDEFELAALDALSQGEDYFVRQKNREIRMVGSLRAVGQCASCHDVERGTLLGAFSYRLVKR